MLSSSIILYQFSFVCTHLSCAHNCSYHMNRVSADFNAPNKDEVFEFMDKAILKSGVNLIDTVSAAERLL